MAEEQMPSEGLGRLAAQLAELARQRPEELQRRVAALAVEDHPALGRGVDVTHTEDVRQQAAAPDRLGVERLRLAARPTRNGSRARWGGPLHIRPQRRRRRDASHGETHRQQSPEEGGGPWFMGEMSRHGLAPRERATRTGGPGRTSWSTRTLTMAEWAFSPS